MDRLPHRLVQSADVPRPEKLARVARRARRPTAVEGQGEEHHVEAEREPTRRHQYVRVDPRLSHREAVQRHHGAACRTGRVHPVLECDHVVLRTRQQTLTAVGLVAGSEMAGERHPAGQRPLRPHAHVDHRRAVVEELEEHPWIALQCGVRGRDAPTSRWRAGPPAVGRILLSSAIRMPPSTMRSKNPPSQDSEDSSHGSAVMVPCVRASVEFIRSGMRAGFEARAESPARPSLRA